MAAPVRAHRVGGGHRRHIRRSTVSDTLDDLDAAKTLAHDWADQLAAVIEPR
ncbi:MAG: hypothetical protein ABSD82_07765 [Solirubrobacteraceae bacterium]|jgi:hypothetical protein